MNQIRTTIYDWNKSCYAPSGDCGSSSAANCPQPVIWFWAIATLATVFAFTGGRR
jgi:hypothetical protein